MLTAEDFQTIAQCGVFQGADSRELPDALRFLNAYDRAYQKGEMIFLLGEPSATPELCSMARRN